LTDETLCFPSPRTGLRGSGCWLRAPARNWSGGQDRDYYFGALRWHAAPVMKAPRRYGASVDKAGSESNLGHDEDAGTLPTQLSRRVEARGDVLFPPGAVQSRRLQEEIARIGGKGRLCPPALDAFAPVVKIQVMQFPAEK
jgi:hypothetical protein